VEYSSKWERATRSYCDSKAAIDLDSEGVLEICVDDVLLSMRNPRAGGRMFLTHVQAREAALLLLEAIGLYRDANDMDIDEGIAAALTALRELAPGAVTA
jgi:hypothetical protein